MIRIDIRPVWRFRTAEAEREFDFRLVSLLAGIAGYTLGSLSPRFIAPYLMSAYNLKFVLDPVMAGGAIAASVLVGLLASIYPAVRVGRLDPIEALRTL